LISFGSVIILQSLALVIVASIPPFTYGLWPYTLVYSADWAIVGEFWVDRMNENAMEYGSEYHDLSEKYRNLFISQESI